MVKQWLTFASRDLRAAKAVHELGSEYKNIVTFNCQQCVEKAIKGYLVFHNVRPPKTHTIKELAKTVSEINPGLGKKLMKADVLTKYAVVYRYPDAEKRPLTVKQVTAALKMAERLYEALLGEVS